MPIRARSLVIRPPCRCHYWYITPDPTGSRLLYVAYIFARPNNYEVPPAQPGPNGMAAVKTSMSHCEIFVSSIDGSHLRRLGISELSPKMHGFTTLQWTTKKQQISFIFNHKLWTLDLRQ